MMTNHTNRFPLNDVRRRGAASLLVIAGAVAGLAVRATAADRFWIGTTGGDWFDQSKWSTTMPPQLGSSPASVPGIGDHARFERGGSTYIVTFIDNVDVNRLSVPTDIVTFDLDTRQLVMSQVTHVGTVANDIGSLTLRNGAVTSPLVFTGLTGGDGRLIIENDATLIVAGSLNPLDATFALGGAPDVFGGVGQMEVLGTVEARDTDAYVGGSLHGVGTATVNGGSWSTDGSLIIGHDGAEGHLFIENGGVVTAGEQTYVGQSGRTNEFVDVTGTGELSITNGSLTTVRTATIGSAENSFGEADLVGANSQWNINGFLFVGEAGIGNLHVRNGAGVHVQNNSFISVGANEGLLNVTGFGSLINDGSLYVGGSSSAAGGPGHLLVQSDGTATIGGLLKVWNTGTLTINGGTVTTNNLIIEPGATFDFATGELNVNAGLLTLPENLLFGGLDILNRPVLRLLNGTSASTTDFFLGELPGTFAEFDVHNSTLNVSNALAVGGDDTQARGSGQLSIQSGGDVSAGGFMRIWETGRVSLDGGTLAGVDAQVSGGAVTLAGAASSLQIDAEGEVAVGVPGVHVGLAPSFSSMRIEAGGTLDAPGLDFNVGFDQSSLAQVDVDDAGSTITAGEARVGALGDGTLTLRNGAQAHFEGGLTTASGTSARGTVLVDGVSSAMTVDGVTTIARQGISLLQISDGGYFHSHGDTRLASEIGPGGPSLAQVTVGAADAEWVSDGSIFVGGDEVGAQGAGQIIVRDDGTLSNVGTMHVWPTGTLTMEGGVLRTGGLVMETGGGLELAGGSIIVDGGQFRAPRDVIVLNGAGPANPVAFSFVNGADAEIALSWNVGATPAAHGVTTVSGVSAGGVRSTLRNTGTGDSSDVVVAVKGTGDMHVLDGALVDAGDDVFIAHQGDAVGVLEVAGVSRGLRSTVLATRTGPDASITVGGRDGVTGGTADLDVYDGGLVETSGDMFIGRAPQSRGDLTLFGRHGLVGEVRVGDDLFLGGSESASGGQGEILVSGGGLLEVGDVFKAWPGGYIDLDGGTIRTNHFDLSDLTSGSFIFFEGRLEANQITGDVVNGGGTLAHGDVVGGMTLDGDYTQHANATLEVEILDLSIAAVADAINISGTATLAGTLSVVMHPEHRPPVGERFTVMTFASRSGTFDNVVANGLALFDIVYHDDSVELVVADSPVGPGDLDENGAVDQGDFVLMHGCMTGPNHADPLDSPCVTPDLNNDKRIDLYDFSLWQNMLSFRGLPGVARWTAPSEGQWKDDPNWRNRAVPISGDQVFIDVPDTVATVTRDFSVQGDSPIGSLFSNEKLLMDRGTLSVAGPFQMNNTLEMSCGTIVDSTVDVGPGAVINVVTGICASTVDGVTINGNVDILGMNNILKVRNGLTLNGAVRLAGFTGSFGNGLMFQGSNRVLDGNGVISFISNPSASFITHDAGSLQVKPGITIRGGQGQVGRSDLPLVQDGVIDSDSAGQIQVQGLDWVNNGALRVRGEGRVLRVGDGWTNHGSIEAANSGQLILGSPGSSFQNLGTITATDADVRLNGDFTIADLGDFDFDDSLIAIEGTFINDTGLVLDSGKLNWKLGRGTVLGGTISSADGTAFGLVPGICCGGDTVLDGVTMDADMNVTDRAQLLKIRNGLTLNGTLRINGHTTAVYLYTSDKSITGTGRIEFLSTTTSNSLRQGDGGTMRIGPGITIEGVNGVVGTNAVQGQTATLINDGVIHANRAGFFQVGGLNWVNNGTLRVSNTSTLMLRDEWTNNGTVRAGGGTLRVFGTWTNHGVLRLGSGPAAQSDADCQQSPTGATVVEISSTAEGGYGKMVVTGTATLDGVLRVEFEDTFTPSAGQSFTVLQYGSRVGQFATIEAPGLDAGLQVVPTYGANSLVIAIEPN